eukprot:PhM_4_TR17399/c0_g1_i1/m.85670
MAFNLASTVNIGAIAVESSDEETSPKKNPLNGTMYGGLSGTLRGMSLTQTFVNTDGDLRKVLTTVRRMSNPRLKEQCVRAEWSALDTEDDREVLKDLAQDTTFWKEVKEMAEADLAALPDEEEDEVDLDTRLKQMFECFDTDGSGSIDTNELHQMLLYMGVPATENEVKEMIRQVDKNGDGSIDMDEFLVVMRNAQSGQMGMAPVRRNTIRRASFRLQADAQVRKLSEMRSPNTSQPGSMRAGFSSASPITEGSQGIPRPNAPIPGIQMTMTREATPDVPIFDIKAADPSPNPPEVPKFESTARPDEVITQPPSSTTRTPPPQIDAMEPEPAPEIIAPQPAAAPPAPTTTTTSNTTGVPRVPSRNQMKATPTSSRPKNPLGRINSGTSSISSPLSRSLNTSGSMRQNSGSGRGAPPTMATATATKNVPSYMRNTRSSTSK